MQKIVEMYKETYLEGILYNSEQLERVFGYAYYARQGKEHINPELENIEEAIHYYMVNKILSGKVDARILDNYKNVFFKVLEVDLTSVIRNPLLKLPKKRLSNIMGSKTYDSLQKRKKRIEESCKKIYEKLEDKKKITQEEGSLLIDYLTSTIGTRDKEIFSMQEAMVKRILKEKGEYGYKEAEFIVGFIAKEELKKYGIEGYCHLSEYQISSSQKFMPNEKGKSIDIRAAINRELGIEALNQKEKIGDFLSTICHEIKHLDQNHKKESGVRNEETMNCILESILNKYLTTDHDKKNAYTQLGELSAELAGYSSATTYLKKYGTRKQVEQLLDSKNDQIYNRWVEKKDSKVVEDADEFKYREVGKLIQNNPELLQEYPQLETIYEKDGQLKRIETLLIERGTFEKKKKEDHPNIYHPVLNLLIDQNKLSQLDISKMNQQEIFSVMHSLSELYNYHATTLHNYLSAKRIGAKFLSTKDDSRNNLEQNIENISIRYQKIESVLDLMYDRFGEDYKKQQEYRNDIFLYKKDKVYTRFQLQEDYKEKNRQDLNEMLSGENSYPIPSVKR